MTHKMIEVTTPADPDTVTNRCDCGEDTITGCGNRPDRHCGLNAEPDTITITISREDWYWMLELASLRIDNDPLSTLEDEERMDRIAALEGER